MFEVLRTVIDGIEHERVESDYELTWASEFGGEDGVLVRTPWMNKLDPTKFPRCICEGNPELTEWHNSSTSCMAKGCGRPWDLGWGEDDFFMRPREKQTEEELMPTLRKLEQDGTYSIRSTTEESVDALTVQDKAEVIQHGWSENAT